MTTEERIGAGRSGLESGRRGCRAPRRSTSRGYRTPATVVLAVALLLAGCSDGDTNETVTMPDETNDATADETNDTMPEETNEALASLAFASAADDARHRCLIETLGAEAERTGLASVPPFDDGGSVTKSWCNDRQADGSACVRGFLDSLNEPGVRALSVFAERDEGGDAVEDYGYRAVRYAEGGNAGSAASPAWSLYYERRSGTQDAFTARFVPDVGNGAEPSRQFSLFQRFGYRDAGIAVRFENELAPGALLASLAESPERFQSVLFERYDTLLADFQRRAADPASALDESERQEAIATARERLGDDRALVEDNAAALHGLLREQVALDGCG